jgi:hypothetical protein
VHTSDLAAGAVTSSKVRNRSLLKKDFKPGQLPAGAKGHRGSPGASSFMGRIEDLSPSDNFAYPTGRTAVLISQEAAVFLSPHATTVARDLSVKLTNAPGAGQFRQFVLNDDGVGVLSCLISNMETTCNSGDDTAVISPGSELAMTTAATPAPTAAAAVFGWRATTP